MIEHDRRASKRKTTRLRPAKLLSRDLQLLGDCAILDRSADGARIGLFATTSLPSILTLFDEGDQTKREVQLAWRNGPQAGLCFAAEPVGVDAGEAERLAGRYYAMS